MTNDDRLASGDEVARIYRLREAGGRPLALERAALPLDLLPNPLAVTGSLYDVMELATKYFEAALVHNIGARARDDRGSTPTVCVAAL